MDPKCPFCGESGKFGSHEVRLTPENVVYIIHCTACGHILGITPKSPAAN